MIITNQDFSLGRKCYPVSSFRAEIRLWRRSVLTDLLSSSQRYIQASQISTAPIEDGRSSYSNSRFHGGKHHWNLSATRSSNARLGVICLTPLGDAILGCPLTMSYWPARTVKSRVDSRRQNDTRFTHAMSSGFMIVRRQTWEPAMLYKN